MTQCQAFINKGKGPQCSRNAEVGSLYCWQHHKNSKSPIKHKEISELLDYHNVNSLYDQYAEDLKLSEQKMPFTFTYATQFYGLQFESFQIQEYKISTIQELFDLYFKLSLIEYTGISDLFPDLTVVLQTLKVYKMYKYSNVCIDPKVYIRSNYRVINKDDYTLEDYQLLCQLWDLEYPNPDVLSFLNGTNDVGTITSGISSIYRQKYKVEKSNFYYYEIELQLLQKYFQILDQFTQEYGLNKTILRTPIKPTFEDYTNFQNTLPFLDDSGVRKWNRENKEYRSLSLGVFVFAYLPFNNYLSYGYKPINEQCWESHISGSVTKNNLIMLKAFNFVIPLPGDVVVHRIFREYTKDKLHINLNLYNGNNFEDSVYISESFFSTSLSFTRYQEAIENIEDYDTKITKIIYSLYVYKGAICVPLFSVTDEYELLFPAGTKYILFEKKVYQNNIIHYTGIIIT